MQHGVLTTEQRDKLAHALAAHKARDGITWRNYFCAVEGDRDMEALVALGLMRRGRTINELYVDDRGMRFTGSWIEVVEVARIRAFAPWNAGGAAGQITPAAWESKPPRCATCGGAVDGVTVYGRYTACGHPIPEGGKVS